MKEKIKNFIKRFSKEIFFALILAVIVAVAIESIKEKTGEEILSKNQKAIAVIITYDKDMKPLGQGSGFFITTNGILVTALHVIEGASFVTAKLSSGAYYDIKKILGADKNLDIAVLQFEAQGTPFVKLGDSDKIESGEKIFAIGAPMGLENTVSEGVISNPSRKLDGVVLVQFTAPISSGSSGGGLFNTSGKVIGITVGSKEVSQEEIGMAQNLNFAIPINLIKKAIEGGGELIEGSPGYFYSLGIIAKNKKEYDKAEENFLKAISLDEKYAAAYTELGMIYYNKGQYDLEIEMFKKAVDLDSNDSDAHYYLATAYEDISQYDLAIDEYKKVIELKPDDTDAIYSLVIIYLMQGEKIKALELASKLVELNPGLGNELKILINRMK